MGLKAQLAAGAVATVATLGLATPAQAIPSSFGVYNFGSQTGAIYWSGTGQIRAWQYCESSSGQTNWYSYGNWVGINTWSVTGTCSIIRDRGADIR